MVIRRSERTHELGRTRTSGTVVEPNTSKTVGWEPVCKCSGELRVEGVGFRQTPVPCTVLDPFGGSGTTLAVAKKPGANAGHPVAPDNGNKAELKVNRTFYFPVSSVTKDGFQNNDFRTIEDGISIELLQECPPLTPAEPWLSMPNTGVW